MTDIADAAAREILTAEYVSGGVMGSFMDIAPHVQVEIIAQAIREAEARENEACAKAADAWATTQPKSGTVSHIIAGAMSECGRIVAAAIRARRG